MLPVNCGSHADYQNLVVTNLRKYYPNPNALARSTWDIIERFWSLDLSFTDTFMADKYSKFGPTPRTPSCMQRSYLLSIDFKVTSLTELAAQLKMNPLYAMEGADALSAILTASYVCLLNIGQIKHAITIKHVIIKPNTDNLFFKNLLILFFLISLLRNCFCSLLIYS